jgi:hypothetical protein
VGRFGENIGDVLKKARVARENKSGTEKTSKSVDAGGEKLISHSQGYSTLELRMLLVLTYVNSR